MKYLACFIYVLALLAMVMILGCSKPATEEVFILSEEPIIEEPIIEEPPLLITGPIYTTSELLSQYETFPRGHHVWVVGYIVSETSSTGIFKIYSSDEFISDPERLKGNVFHISDRKDMMKERFGIGEKLSFKVQLINKGMGRLQDVRSKVKLINGGE